MTKTLADCAEEHDLDKDDRSAKECSDNGVWRQVASNVDEGKSSDTVDASRDSSHGNERDEADAAEKLIDSSALDQGLCVGTGTVIRIAQIEHRDGRASEDVHIAHDGNAGTSSHQPRNVLADALDALRENVALLRLSVLVLVLAVSMDSEDDEHD